MLAAWASRSDCKRGSCWLPIAAGRMLTPTNKKAADRVLLFMTKAPVALVGAGMSAPRYKSWPGLVAELGQRLGVPLDANVSLLKQCQIFCDRQRDDYAAALTDIFLAVPDGCREALKQLVMLDFCAFLTTNFDWSVYRALKEIGHEPRILIYPVMLPSECCGKALLQVHGAIDKTINLDHFVLHEAAYLRAYHDPPLPPLSAFFYEIFNRHDVLFVGYGLGEEERLRDVLKICQRVQIERRNDRERLMLRAIPSAVGEIASFEKENLYFHAQFGIEVVAYDRVDPEHGGLDAVIAEVHRMRPIPRPQVSNPLTPMLSSQA